MLLYIYIYCIYVKGVGYSWLVVFIDFSGKENMIYVFRHGTFMSWLIRHKEISLTKPSPSPAPFLFCWWGEKGEISLPPHPYFTGTLQLSCSTFFVSLLCPTPETIPIPPFHHSFSLTFLSFAFYPQSRTFPSSFAVVTHPLATTS